MKQKWKTVLLSMPAAFSIIPQSQWWVEAFNRRQQTLQEHESLSRSALQIALEVMSMKGILEAQFPSKKFTAQTLSQELLGAGLQQVIGGNQKEDDASAGSLSPNLISSALNIHKSVLSSPQIVEILLDMEARYGTRSCFHKPTSLNVIATKPSSSKTRLFIVEAVNDWLLRGLLRVGDVTKSTLGGDKHHCGLVQLFECKLKVT